MDELVEVEGSDGVVGDDETAFIQVATEEGGVSEEVVANVDGVRAVPEVDLHGTGVRGKDGDGGGRGGGPQGGHGGGGGNGFTDTQGQMRNKKSGWRGRWEGVGAMEVVMGVAGHHIGESHGYGRVHANKGGGKY